MAEAPVPILSVTGQPNAVKKKVQQIHGLLAGIKRNHPAEMENVAYQVLASSVNLGFHLSQIAISELVRVRSEEERRDLYKDLGVSLGLFENDTVQHTTDPIIAIAEILSKDPELNKFNAEIDDIICIGSTPSDAEEIEDEEIEDEEPEAATSTSTKNTKGTEDEDKNDSTFKAPSGLKAMGGKALSKQELGVGHEPLPKTSDINRKLGKILYDLDGDITAAELQRLRTDFIIALMKEPDFNAWVSNKEQKQHFDCSQAMAAAGLIFDMMGTSLIANLSSLLQCYVKEESEDPEHHKLFIMQLLGRKDLDEGTTDLARKMALALCYKDHNTNAKGEYKGQRSTMEWAMFICSRLEVHSQYQKMKEWYKNGTKPELTKMILASGAIKAGAKGARSGNHPQQFLNSLLKEGGYKGENIVNDLIKPVSVIYYLQQFFESSGIVLLLPQGADVTTTKRIGMARLQKALEILDRVDKRLSAFIRGTARGVEHALLRPIMKSQFIDNRLYSMVEKPTGDVNIVGYIKPVVEMLREGIDKGLIQQPEQMRFTELQKNEDAVMED